MEEDKKIKVQFAPEFIEQLSKFPEEDREKILAGLAEFREQIESNPHVGTPLDQGILRNRTFRNWVARKWVDWKNGRQRTAQKD